MSYQEGRALPADPNLCPPFLGAMLIRGRAQLMGVLIIWARTLHMLCMHSLGGSKGWQRPRLCPLLQLQKLRQVCLFNKVPLNGINRKRWIHLPTLVLYDMKSSLGEGEMSL